MAITLDELQRCIAADREAEKARKAALVDPFKRPRRAAPGRARPHATGRTHGSNMKRKATVYSRAEVIA